MSTAARNPADIAKGIKGHKGITGSEVNRETDDSLSRGTNSTKVPRRSFTLASVPESAAVKKRPGGTHEHERHCRHCDLRARRACGSRYHAAVGQRGDECGAGFAARTDPEGGRPAGSGGRRDLMPASAGRGPQS